MGQALNNLRIGLRQERAALVRQNAVAKDLATVQKRMLKVRKAIERAGKEDEQVGHWYTMTEKTIKRFVANKSNEFASKKEVVKIMKRFADSRYTAQDRWEQAAIANDAYSDLFKAYNKAKDNGEFED